MESLDENTIFRPWNSKVDRIVEFHARRVRGFTLTGRLAAITIIGILVALTTAMQAREPTRSPRPVRKALSEQTSVNLAAGGSRQVIQNPHNRRNGVPR